MPSTTEERDAKICARYLEGVKVPRLALDSGLSLPRIQQILKAGDVIGKPREVKAGDDFKTISADHTLIGKKVSIYRMITIGVGRAYLAEKLEWSAVKLSYVEQGIFNLTLVDLQKLAETMQITLSELLERETK